MFPSTVKIICPENEDDVSSVINVIVYLWKIKVDHHETTMTNPDYDYDDDNFNDSDLLEADSNDGNQ